MRTLAERVQRAGPYLLVELLLPGGTLFALLLFLYRNRPRGWQQASARAPVVAARTMTPAWVSTLRMQMHEIAAVARCGTVADLRDSLEPLAMLPTPVR